jgi:hypothetical protein
MKKAYEAALKVAGDVDAPGEYIDTVIEEWKKGNPSNEDIADIMNIARGDRA